jgi:hypothetical protein
MLGHEQRFGLKWEQWALGMLHTQGYRDARLVSNFFADIDIMIGNLPVEIKAATARRHFSKPGYTRLRWQFDVSRLPKLVDSIVILIAVAEQPYPFIVPSWLLACRSNVHITSHPLSYRGWYAPYLANWSMIQTGLEMRQRFNGQLHLGTEFEPANLVLVPTNGGLA